MKERSIEIVGMHYANPRKKEEWVFETYNCST